MCDLSELPSPSLSSRRPTIGPGSGLISPYHSPLIHSGLTSQRRGLELFFGGAKWEERHRETKKTRGFHRCITLPRYTFLEISPIPSQNIFKILFKSFLQISLSNLTYLKISQIIFYQTFLINFSKISSEVSVSLSNFSQHFRQSFISFRFKF